MESEQFLAILNQKPNMEDRITLPLYGNGIVIGLNDNYMGTDQTWVMVKWNDGRESQLQYKVSEQKDL